MQFFLCEIVARVVAIYFCVDAGCKLWNGLFERKAELCDDDILDSDPWIFQRDEMPVRYWMAMGSQIITFIACLVMAIFGWFLPT